MTTITFEEEMLSTLENLAKRKLTNVETIVKEAVQHYFSSSLSKSVGTRNINAITH